MGDNSLISLIDVSKTYGASTVLRHVSFELMPNTIHGIVGANGAGKSTLINILSGAIQPNEGTIQVAGKDLPIPSPRDALGAGIVTMHQELELIPHLSIWENLWLDKLPLHFPLINLARAKSQSQELLKRVDLAIPVETKVSRLTIAQQQLVYLARIIREPEPMRLLILDEPSASLGVNEQRTLHQTLLRLKSKSLGIILVSHKLEEIISLCDRITVLRDGQVARHFSRDTVQVNLLIDEMIGPNAKSEFTARPSPETNTHKAIKPPSTTTVCRLNRISTARIREASIEMGAGLITAVTGLAGSGHEDIPLVVAGVVQPISGTMSHNGMLVRLNRRTATHMGIAFVPEDRKADGIFPSLSVDDNILITAYPTQVGILSRAVANRTVRELVQKFHIRGYTPTKPVKYLSGGNQQKVLIARWLSAETRVLVMSEPTRGVDVAARSDIHEFLMDFAHLNNMAVLLSSTDVDEMYQVADVIYTFADGRVSGRFDVAHSALDDVQRAVL